MPNVVVMQDPTQGHDRARSCEHRGPDYAKARFFDGEAVQVVASCDICREALFCPSVAVCVVQQRAGEESRDGSTNAEGEVDKARLPLVEVVCIDEQDGERRVDARINDVEEAARENDNGVVPAGKYRQRFQGVRYSPLMVYGDVAVLRVTHDRLDR